MAWSVRCSLMTVVAILFVVIGRSVAFSNDCNITRRFATSILHTSDAVQNSSKTDRTLKICSANSTCCTREMELKLAEVSEEMRVKMVSQLQGSIQEIFRNTSKNFTGFFKSLIETSYKNLDTLYSRTYQDVYTNHKAIIRDLFTKLGDYMAGKEDMDLKQTTESWFSLLFQKVFMISKPGVNFDATYQHCILETADELMPFGDIPRKISLQIKKSFLASKVLQDALGVGAKVIDELLKMKANEQCSEAFAKMTYCRICSGVDASAKPCFNYCLNVIKGCSAYPAIVNPHWNAYITALQRLAIKADGPFSMEAVIDPLGVKISGGIMLFQNNRDNITNHVMRKCGKLPPAKLLKKRSIVDDMSYPYKFDTEHMVRPTTAYGTNLYRLVSKLKTTLSMVKNHWVSLPRTVCSSEMAAPEGSSEKCWNGENVDGYSKPVVKDGVEEMFKNPEVVLNKNQPHLTVPRQIIKLKEITQRILSAANGADSNRIDLEETSGDGSGVGSGFGSGSGDGSGSGVEATSQPRTRVPTTTEMSNEVEQHTTKFPRFRTTTMGNFIPGADDNSGKPSDDHPNQSVDQPKSSDQSKNANVQKSSKGNSAHSITCNCLTHIFLLTFCVSFLFWK